MKIRCAFIPVSTFWTFLQLLTHYTQHLSSRWNLISRVLSENKLKACGPLICIRSRCPDEKGVDDTWTKPLTTSQCQWVHNQLPEDLLQYVEKWHISSHFNYERNFHKEIILIPPINKCMSCGEKLKMINRLDCVSFPLIFTHDGTKVGNRPDTAESGLATLREVRICQNMTNFVRIPRS